MNRRVLVTGATGFVGAHVVRALLAAGDEPVALVRPSSKCDEIARTVKVVQFDETTESLIAVLAEVQPDAVMHLASLFIAEHKPEEVTPLIQSNVLFGAQLLEAMSQCGVGVLVSAGTSWQHFEGAEYDPVCLYAATKQAFDDIARFYVSARGLRLQTLQLFDTYGADDPRPKLVSTLRRISTDGGTLQLSPGAQMVDFAHVDDVADAFLVALDRAEASADGTAEVWAVSGGERMSLRDFVSAWSSATGRDVDVVWGGRAYRAREVMRLWDGPALPGWMPRHSLAEGLAELR